MHEITDFDCGDQELNELCGFVLSESRKNKNRDQKIMFYVLDPLLYE